MSGAAGRFARLFGQGLSLAIGRRPDRPLLLAGFGAFLAAWCVAMAVYALQHFLVRPPPRAFNTYSTWDLAGVGAAVLAIAWLVAHVQRRPAVWLTLATLVLVVMLPWSVLDMQLAATMGKRADPFRLGVAALFAVLAARTAWVAGADAPRLRRLCAGLVFALLLGVPWQARGQFWLWYTQEPGSGEINSSAIDSSETGPGKPDQDEPDPGVPEPVRVIERQPGMVQGRLARLAPQVPGKIDLYAIGFAGDGGEGTFRNEVEYLDHLLAQRYNLRDHMLPLVNHPGT
ncbi:MAG: hypothetical protein ACREO3_00080, partial [Arenimonas sp.]